MAVGETVAMDLGGAVVAVTPLDARHCVGSVMFLFEGTFGRVLHTGDFRWDVQSLPHELLRGPLDVLYLDNTYCNPIYTFPSRETALLMIEDAIRAHPGHQVVIGLDTVGKGEVVRALAESFGVPVAVSQERVLPLRLAGVPKSCYTLDEALTWIRVMPKWKVTKAFIAELQEHRPTIGIVPTALFAHGIQAAAREETIVAANGQLAMVQPLSSSLTLEPAAQQDLSSLWPRNPAPAIGDGDFDWAMPTDMAQGKDCREQCLLFHIPYSSHCSFAEMGAFVAQLRPRKIVPVVPPKERPGMDIDPRHHFSDLVAGADVGGGSGQMGALQPQLPVEQQQLVDRFVSAEARMAKKRSTGKGATRLPTKRLRVRAFWNSIKKKGDLHSLGVARSLGLARSFSKQSDMLVEATSGLAEMAVVDLVQPHRSKGACGEEDMGIGEHSQHGDHRVSCEQEMGNGEITQHSDLRISGGDDESMDAALGVENVSQRGVVSKQEDRRIWSWASTAIEDGCEGPLSWNRCERMIRAQSPEDFNQGVGSNGPSMEPHNSQTPQGGSEHHHTPQSPWAISLGNSTEAAISPCAAQTRPNDVSVGTGAPFSLARKKVKAVRRVPSSVAIARCSIRNRVRKQRPLLDSCTASTS
ncbi:unnamed protein product [Ostreobium quekettii]|uniref:Protein artemis n=1 Tax=Ostreobium quekettii TaxID=121088 RepID=A0A8S1IVV3_9CHLO|nr:unnamed protein product [Ostreobium quekettii]|eukprot:evm.model.scf_235.8 EVM.evm.TU.scf_235.8   scf_235:51918-56135(-)